MKRILFLMTCISICVVNFAQSEKDLALNYRLLSSKSNPVAYLKKQDSIIRQSKRIIQGVYLEGIGRYFGGYSFGYEWTQLKHKNGFGFSVGMTVYPKFNSPAGIRYANFYLGFSGFYEYGKNWGFRVGINEGIAYNPIVSGNRLNHIANADKPFTLLQYNTLFVGGFYRTKNLKWQFLLTANSTYYFFLQKYWGKWPFLLPMPGLIVKYNFKTK